MVPVKKLGEVRERYREMADGRSVWEWKEYTLCVLLDEGEYVLILDEEGTVIGGEVPDGDYEVEEIKLEGIGREVHVYREQIEMEG
ncbi:MAG: hypothetical protein D6746_16040 [Bacteroidetes bacterium]|nr:MAG: hypothetical protein D6746_16040 [Bacteroidota bacterium]